MTKKSAPPAAPQIARSTTTELTPDAILERLSQEGVKFLRLQFCDILGTVKKCKLRIVAFGVTSYR